MSAPPLASVVINNYNYARYLGEAIESALAQVYPHTEVVVVDDGSTDGSREVIRRFGERVRPVLKPNGGQASALNAGFRASRGEVVLFLDADDLLDPTAVAEAVLRFADPAVVKVHWPLRGVDDRGRLTGETIPGEPLPEGDMREEVWREGPTACISAPTSGNAWSRRFLERVFPIPEAEYGLCADTYLFALAPAFGVVRAHPMPLASYRLHGANNYWGKSFEEQLEFGYRSFDALCDALGRFGGQGGLPVDRQQWRDRSWYHRLNQSVEEITALVPAGASLVLIDDDAWGTGDTLFGRPRFPFLERDGQYWGAPARSRTAVRELERLRGQGAGYLVCAWPSFWWLEHYRAFAAHLREQFPCRVANDRIRLFDLGAAS